MFVDSMPREDAGWRRLACARCAPPSLGAEQSAPRIACCRFFFQFSNGLGVLEGSMCRNTIDDRTWHRLRTGAVRTAGVGDVSRVRHREM